MICNRCEAKALPSRYNLFCQVCWHCVQHCSCTAGYTPEPEVQARPLVGCKCVVVEVHIAHVGPNTCPGKIAQGVRWCLEGATVPGFTVSEATGRNCTCADHQEPTRDWWEGLLKGLSPAK